MVRSSSVCQEVGDERMFMGEYKHNLDAKGRITLPSKFREKFDDTVIVARGFDGCLSVYTPQEWEKFYTKLQQMPITKKQTRAFVRMITSKATECEIDKMGRINIPPGLREQAHLEKNCSIVGSLNHVEIWDTNMWEDYYNQENEQFEEIAEEMDFTI